jgi:hypothetical protein
VEEPVVVVSPDCKLRMAEKLLRLIEESKK